MVMPNGQGGVNHTTALAAYNPSRDGGGVQPPMVEASTYRFSTADEGRRAFSCAYGLQPREQDDPDARPELIYARLTTPSMNTTEEVMKSLEPGADWASLFPSGMAALTTLVHSTCHHPFGGVDLALGERRRDVIIYGTPIYGGTHGLMEIACPRWGFTGVAVNMSDLPLLQHVIETYRDRIGLVLCETPANPTIAMVDIGAVRRLLERLYPDEKHRPTFAVDNTFAGIFQHPLMLGADVAVYSATKFLGGHADLIGGMLTGLNGSSSVVVKSFVGGLAEVPLINVLMGNRTILGYTPSSEMAHKLSKHIQTYVLRMRRQAAVATIVASWLVAHPKVRKVYFPTLLIGEEAELYSRQMTGPSSMIAFELVGATEADAFRFLNTLEQILLAVSLGFIRSLAEHPASMTHSDITPVAQEKMGITPGLIRLSVGIEEPEDLIRDLEAALAVV